MHKEMAGRVTTENTVPELARGYLYYIRYEEGENFPIYCRKKAGDRRAKEEVHTKRIINSNSLID